jgi:acetyl-CoA carboxylase biotin carboxylase subunit/3-methylcrotonyl-CoA carboxylase alpha subunit
MFKKVLIANRGEIACRVIRTCKRLGIKTVAVYSEADAGAPHVKQADEAVLIGPAPVKDSYLKAEAIVEAARSTGADAVHPGYGLLSEKRSFAEAIAAAGITFIGPTPETLDAFGDKIKARAVARAAGVSPPPGSDGPISIDDMDAVRAIAETVGFPLLVKAAGGGGGIGMAVVQKIEDLEKAAKTCSDRGRSAFSDERVYLERYMSSPRHIEVQVICDAHGNGVALGERECSMQRRHQKVLEESPSPAVFFQGEAGEARRAKLHADALRIVKSIGYVNAGTVEFIADANGDLWFLEVNARLQVEHPVTEMVTGLDLVELQLLVASGEKLPEGTARAPRGHSIEARVYAEDPSKSFAPQPGKITRLTWPAASESLRIETGVEEGSEVTPYYDPMIAKVVVHAPTRAEAITALDNALGATDLELTGARGVAATNLSYLRKAINDARFASGAYDTLVAEAIAKGK